MVVSILCLVYIVVHTTALSLDYVTAQANHHHDTPSHLKNGSRGMNPRIYGGIDAPIDMYTPYMVAIFRRKGNGKLTPSCAGIQLSFDMVLTAAHCASSSDVVYNNMYTIKETSSINQRLNIRKYTVDRAILHPRYNNETKFDNDLCLLTLTVDTTFEYYTSPPALGSAYIPSIQLNYDITQPIINDIMSVAGWGVTETDFFYSNKLRHTTVSPISNEKCIEVLSYQNTQKVTSNMLCCTPPPDQVNNDACQGDSGGPLVLHTGEQGDLLVGLVSFGYTCGGSKPGVYSRIAENVGWIEEIVCSTSQYSVCENGALRRRGSVLTTRLPTVSPTYNPEDLETSVSPIIGSTVLPVGIPTMSPAVPFIVSSTLIPTTIPTSTFGEEPTHVPTNTPSKKPSLSPTNLPTTSPTGTPTGIPVLNPTDIPTEFPTLNPTLFPTNEPTDTPTILSTKFPSTSPTSYPTRNPTNTPSEVPTRKTTLDPTELPPVLPANPTRAPVTSFPSQAQLLPDALINASSCRTVRLLTFLPLITVSWVISVILN